MKNQTFEQKFKNGCLISKLSNSIGPIVVGFSGGSDSSALLFSVNLEFALKRKTIAVHVNHGLRGDDSVNDARQAKSFCISRNIIFHQENVKLPSNSSLGLEADARNLRMDVFKKYLKKYNSTVLVLGQHLNDNAETILMRLFEGSGIKGLSGIQQNSLHSFVNSNDNIEAKSTFGIFRPMLNIKKEEIMKFCKLNEIEFVEDKTNNDKARFRNNIRHSVLPLLTESFGDSVVENIVSSSTNIDQARLIHDEVLHTYVLEHVVIDKDTVKISAISKLKKKSLAIRSGIIKFVLDTAIEINGEVKKQRLPIKKYILSIDSLIQSENPSSMVSLGKGIEVRREYEEIQIGVAIAKQKIEKIFPLEIEGITNLEEFGMYAETNLNENVNSHNEVKNNRNTIFLDNDTLEQEIVIRTRKEGDRFYPRNSNGSKKLKKYFIDLKIPKIQRDEIPLLAVGSEIIWVFGYDYSRNYQVTESTSNCLEITVNKMEIN